MAADKNIRQCPRDVFSDYLARQHKRRTAERYAILDCAMRSSDHFTIESFHERIEQEGFHVSLATIYNTLELLVDCGLVRRHRFGSDSARYERTAGSANHHHLVCSRCGKVREVRDTALSKAIASMRYPGFTPSYFSLNIYGLCRSCQKRERKGASSDQATNKTKTNTTKTSSTRNQKK